MNLLEIVDNHIKDQLEETLGELETFDPGMERHGLTVKDFYTHWEACAGLHDSAISLASNLMIDIDARINAIDQQMLPEFAQAAAHVIKTTTNLSRYDRIQLLHVLRLPYMLDKKSWEKSVFDQQYDGIELEVMAFKIPELRSDQQYEIDKIETLADENRVVDALRIVDSFYFHIKWLSIKIEKELVLRDQYGLEQEMPDYDAILEPAKKEIFRRAYHANIQKAEETLDLLQKGESEKDRDEIEPLMLLQSCLHDAYLYHRIAGTNIAADFQHIQSLIQADRQNLEEQVRVFITPYRHLAESFYIISQPTPTS